MYATLEVVCGDVRELDCDVLVLKYAQSFYGADNAVAHALGVRDAWPELAPGEHRLVPTNGRLRYPHVLFRGVGELWDFGYPEIRSFAAQSLADVAGAGVERRTVGMTMHGVGYGLDEREAFTAQVAGLMEYMTTTGDDRLRQIRIVERDPNRCQRLQALLRQLVLETGFRPADGSAAGAPARLPDAGARSDQKRHVFVAMPYSDEMEDIFEFGIREPVNEAGCLCERCDRDIFTGDILDRIKNRISSAWVVVADMTGANPNVYLEVGYAWGRGVPTLLVAKDGQELKFDVRTQKCIYYKNISHLRNQLRQAMRTLLAAG